MHEKKLADDHGNGHQPINKPRKGSVPKEISPATRSVKLGGDRRSRGAAAKVRLYRCETTGHVAPVREHVEALCARYTHACAQSIVGSIYRFGRWYTYRFTQVSGPVSRTKVTLSERMRALIEAAPSRDVWTAADFAVHLQTKVSRVHHVARALTNTGELERVKPFTYRVVRRAEVAHV
jgi:hypothetical protein